LAARKKTVGPDHMPVGPIKRILKQVKEERERKRDFDGQHLGLIDMPMGPVDSMAFDIYGEKVDAGAGRGNTQRAIWRILHDQEWIHFDRADKILLGLGLQHLWNSDPELREIIDGGILAECDRIDAERIERERRRKEAGPPKHGTTARYQSKYFKCRCEPCTTAASEYSSRKRRERLARLERRKATA
jgi:hypothetical protein